MRKSYVLWFREISIKDIAVVGGKNASLGEMFRELTHRGISVPDGFAITADAYRHLLEHSGISKAIREQLKGLDVKNVRQLAERGSNIRKLIREAAFPDDLKKAIADAYARLSSNYNVRDVDVAVRSSATAEDLPEASFAGQQESFLNIRGAEMLIDACRKCFASLFTDRAIAYREEKGFDHFRVALSIGVQKMVRSDLASSGVMFTLDTETGFPDVVFITSGYGLGENIVQGAIDPDEFYVFKPTFRQGFPAIIQKSLGRKQKQMICSKNPARPTRNIAVPKNRQQKFSLTDREVLQLAKWGMIIEEHYSQKKGRWTPMDIEWAKDSRLNKLFIVQARPETVQSRKERGVLEEYVLEEKGRVVAVGKSVGSRISRGKAHVIRNVRDIHRFHPGDVLITEMTDPDWVPIMRQASAIVTDRGGRTSHAAIVSRELGLPCVVGTGNGTSRIRTGQNVTVSCAEGEEGKVYDRLLKFSVKRVPLKAIPKTRTKVMMNIGNPEEAFELSFIPCQGVGLAREEFIISEYIKVHPNALIYFDRVRDAKVRKLIEEHTAGYAGKAEYFVEKLAQGIAMIAAAFYPNDVIVRTSDFKSNEYASLVGGDQFEPKEENPMIGWRGASRYYKEGYGRAFALECLALRKVRDEFGLANVKVMIPFCRTVDEGKRVIQAMKDNGLVQGKNSLEVYVMCEIPSNVVLAEEFAKVFDGFSIGSNDLTQLTLGLDRDSSLVADLYDERNEAVLRMIEYAIRTARQHKRKIGICGQAPSDYPDFAEFLVRCGIDSISLNPDAIIRATMAIARIEKRIGQKDRQR